MIDQRTDGWHMQRAGKITASRFSDAISMKLVGREPNKQLVSTDARNTYMREIVSAILSGSPKPEINSSSLQWGRDVEPFAREAYEFQTGNLVNESGFVSHKDHGFIGCSPDGLVGSFGGVEIKCPKDPQIHIKTMLEGMPADHTGQVQGCMFVTGRDWWDFVSYDPRQRDGYRLYVQRIYRDDEYIKNLERGLIDFWSYVQESLQKINVMYDKRKSELS